MRTGPACRSRAARWLPRLTTCRRERSAASVTPRRWCSAEALQRRTEAGPHQLQLQVSRPASDRLLAPGCFTSCVARDYRTFGICQCCRDRCDIEACVLRAKEWNPVPEQRRVHRRLPAETCISRRPRDQQSSVRDKPRGCNKVTDIRQLMVSAHGTRPPPQTTPVIQRLSSADRNLGHTTN